MFQSWTGAQYLQNEEKWCQKADEMNKITLPDYQDDRFSCGMRLVSQDLIEMRRPVADQGCVEF